MEMKTMVTPMRKLSVSWWPNSAADMMPVKMVATVEEYFLRMVSAYLKKKEDRMPCSALFMTSSIVTCAHDKHQRGVSADITTLCSYIRQRHVYMIALQCSSVPKLLWSNC